MTFAETLMNTIVLDIFADIETVSKIEYPTELNAFIIVLKNGKRYRVEITEETPALPF